MLPSTRISLPRLILVPALLSLGRTLLAYGLAARIPVAGIMFLAMMGRWGTHYDYVGMPPEFQMGCGAGSSGSRFFPNWCSGCSSPWCSARSQDRSSLSLPAPASNLHLHSHLDDPRWRDAEEVGGAKRVSSHQG